MKTLFLLGAAAIATAPLLREGGEEAAKKSCCKTTACETAAPSATLASVVKPATKPAYDPDSTGSILVTALFEGDVPERLADLVIDAAKSEGCSDHQIDRTDRTRLITEDGRIANVVVTVEIEGQRPEIPEEPILIDQRGCRFEPHIAVLPVGAHVRFANSDAVNHNVHTFAKRNSPLNRNIAGGSEEVQRLEKDETIEVKCDIHPWMRGYIHVTEAARYGATNLQGTSSLEGLPPGDYKVKYWHEELGKGTSEVVTVAAGAATELELRLGGEKKKKGRRGR